MVFLCSQYLCERKCEDVRQIPVEGTFERAFAYEVEAAEAIKHISKNSAKSSKIPDYTCRARVLRDVK